MSKVQNFHGVLPVYKPRGMISKDVSRFLTKKLGKVKLGHLGTLDPMAEGLLPILMGSATRLQDQLLELPKKYEFEVTFGTETDTLDGDGQVVRHAETAHLTREILEKATLNFQGKISQRPPAYSAAKYKGRPLYEYARNNKLDLVPFDELAREVEIFSFELTGFSANKAEFSAECSKGTYVRVLAKDLADSVGSCGTVTKIVRSKCGGFTMDQAVTIEQVEEKLSEFASLLVPIAGLGLTLGSWQSIEPVWTKRLRTGQKLLVRQDHFQKCLKNGAFQDSSEASNFFLMDEVGVTFGIGCAMASDNGCVQVSMTRGLQ